MSKDGDDIFGDFFLQQHLKNYWEKIKDDSLICDDTWNMLNMQHIAPNLKLWDYSDIHGVGHQQD